MRRNAFGPVEGEEMVSTNYRRRPNEIASNPIKHANGSQVEPSQIAKFYDGRSIFVTGVSGFIGKLLIEKLLRACTGLRRIYVLIRPKQKKTAKDRFEELFSSPIFDKIRDTQFDSDIEAFQRFTREKVHLLQGDLTGPLLGLTEDEVELMAEEVSVVLHSAAVVSYEGKFRRSIQTNLGGTYNVMEVASRLPKLASFVHVSTCYSNCMRREVDEHIYPLDQDPMKLINLVQFLEDEMLDLLRGKLIGEHPNQYTYTKQLAEYLVGQYATSRGLPVIICRPSIVIETLEEPIVGFTDNHNGMCGAFWDMNQGLLRTMTGVGTSLADQVPADIVVNSIIALGWFGAIYNRVGTSIESSGTPELTGSLADKVAQYYRDRKAKLANKLDSDDSLRRLAHRELIRVPVCHVSSGVENPISFHEMLEHVAAGGKRYPSINLFREPRCRFTSNPFLRTLKRFWFHTLTGLLLNLFSVSIVAPSRRPHAPSLNGRHSYQTTRVDWSREFQRVNRFGSVLAYFTSNTWYFNPEMRQRLMKDFMNDEDNRIFYCDTSNIDWRQFGDKIAIGMRKHIFGEPEDTIREARLKYLKTYWRNTTLQLLLVSIGFYILYMLILF